MPHRSTNDSAPIRRHGRQRERTRSTNGSNCDKRHERRICGRTSRLRRLPQSRRAQGRLDRGRSSDSPPLTLEAFSPAAAGNGTSIKIRRSDSSRRLRIACGIQRPDRPGISPEFPVRGARRGAFHHERTDGKLKKRRCQHAEKESGRTGPSFDANGTTRPKKLRQKRNRFNIQARSTNRMRVRRRADRHHEH